MGESSSGMKTLGPAVGFVAETAGAILRDMEGVKGGKAKKSRDLVEWVLEAPSRLKTLKEEGKNEEAAEQWSTIQKLSNTWEEKGVQGAVEVRDACQAIMGTSSPMPGDMSPEKSFA